MTRTVRLGNLEITMERVRPQRYQVSVSLSGTAIPGVSSEASEDALLDLANQLYKTVRDREIGKD